MTQGWPVKYVGKAELPYDSPEDQEFFEKAAVDYLWAWTGHTFGTSEKTVRPAWRHVGSVVSCSMYDQAGRTLRYRCPQCRSENCGCGSAYWLRLPGRINKVLTVHLGDADHLGDEYRWDSIYVYSQEPWPTTQDLSKPLGQPGTWGVTYLQGLDVPNGGQIAAGLLAKELFKSAVGDDNCVLPERVQSLSRQGVTMDMFDGFEDLDQGRTGIWLVDSWVMSVTKPQPKAKVFGLDVPRKV